MTPEPNIADWPDDIRFEALTLAEENRRLERERARDAERLTYLLRFGAAYPEKP